MAAGDLVAHFSGIHDPRCAGKIEHRLMDVLVIAVQRDKQDENPASIKMRTRGWRIVGRA